MSQELHDYSNAPWVRELVIADHLEICDYWNELQRLVAGKEITRKRMKREWRRYIIRVVGACVTREATHFLGVPTRGQG